MLPKPTTCEGCPLYVTPYGKSTGFTYKDGNGTSGVCVIAEAPGKDEEIEGRPLVGKSGQTLFQELGRVGIYRDDLTIHNVLSCRPPDNKLVNMPFEREAIVHCAPNLDKVIEDARAVAKANGKTFTIVTLGVTPFKRILGLDYKRDAALLKRDYYAYPFWSDKYRCWALNAPHPAYLVRGKTHLWPIVHFVFTRAKEIAEHGLTLDTTPYTLDPSSAEFDEWIKGYLISLEDRPDNPLSYDIETPYKRTAKDEEDLSKEEAILDGDHTILRISFSYEFRGSTYTTSIKWSAEYMAGIEKLFSVAKFVLGWNSDKYDYPRVARYLKIKGVSLDGMVAWHFLNTSLPKSLGFVTPYYWQNTAVWKYLSDSEPAFYNAKDADAALRNFIGIKADLIKNKLWTVFESHWIELAKALKFMTDKGVLMDQDLRGDAEAKMSAIMETIEAQMESAVPLEARKLKIYKKEPKVIIDGMFSVERSYPVAYCSSCGLLAPKRWKKHTTLCGGPSTDIMESKSVWAKPLEFKVSKLGMTNYQSALKHQAIRDRKEKKITFNADAITMLVKKYPKDPLYPLILDHRKVSKLLGTYVGYTQYNRIKVNDDYILQSGEKWADEE